MELLSASKASGASFEDGYSYDSNSTAQHPSSQFSRRPLTPNPPRRPRQVSKQRPADPAHFLALETTWQVVYVSDLPRPPMAAGPCAERGAEVLDSLNAAACRNLSNRSLLSNNWSRKTRIRAGTKRDAHRNASFPLRAREQVSSRRNNPAPWGAWPVIIDVPNPFWNWRRPAAAGPLFDP